MDQLTAENRVLELKVQKLQRMLWDKRSERMPHDDKQAVLFDEPAAAKSAAAAAPGAAAKKSTTAAHPPKGPKPLDPELPREVIQVPAPELMRHLDELVAPLLVALKGAYCAKAGAVWFEYQTSKSPVHPDATLKAMRFSGYCQTDGAKLAPISSRWNRYRRNECSAMIRLFAKIAFRSRAMPRE